jgi:tetratricopeptide (TPR) repeat protein
MNRPTPNIHRHRYFRFTLCAAVFGCLIINPGIAAADSDCVFEFNKAYSTSNEGVELMQLAQQYAAAEHFEEAKSGYQNAIKTLQAAVEHYQNLPKIVFDCSPANLTIARNNIRIAEENIARAQESLSGMDCVRELAKLEEISQLASDYYHKSGDMLSAKTAADDALKFAAGIEDSNICIGSYSDNLNAQKAYANRIADSLRARAQYDTCDAAIRQTLNSEAAAKKTAYSGDREKIRASWQSVVKQTDDALQFEGCQKEQISRLRKLRQSALDRLK